MLRISRRFFSLMACAAVTCLLGGALVRGDDTASGGTISGTVTNNGQPVSGATVRVTAPHEKAPASSSDPSDSGSKKHKAPAAIAETTTGADGTYTLSNVPAGDYTVTAMLKGTGVGHEKVTVTAGSTSKVDIALKEMKKKDSGSGSGSSSPSNQ